MSRIGYSVKLFREFVRFGRVSKAYWIIPVILILGIAALLIVVGQASSPLIYTLF